MKQVIETLFKRGTAFVTAPEQGVLAPYQRQRSGWNRLIRGSIGLALLILVGAIYGFYFVLLPPSFLLMLFAPIALLGLLVIWALPDQETAPTELMVRCFIGFLLAAALWPNYLAISLPGLPWISMRRLMLGPMCILLLISLSTSAGFRKTMGSTLSALPALWKMLAAFVVIQFLSMVTAKHPVDAVSDFLNYQTLWTAIFFVSLYAFRDDRRIAAWFTITIVSAVILCVIGGLEWHNKRILWADHIPWFLQVDNDFLPGLLSGNFRGGKYRVATTFSHTLAFAEYMMLVTPIAIHGIFTARKILSRGLFVAIDLALFALILSTQSRLGFVGFLLAHVLYLGIWAIKRWKTHRGTLIGPAITLAYPALLVALCIAVVSVDALRIRVLGGGATAASNAGREAQRAAWLPALVKSPPFGNGPRQGPEALGYMVGGKPSIDNYYIWISLDYGVIGFLLFYGMLFYALFKVLRIGLNARDPTEDYAIVIAIILTLFLFSKNVLSQEDNHYMPFLLMGMTVALLARAKLRYGDAGSTSK
jgi:hypothetical protein